MVTVISNLEPFIFNVGKEQIVRTVLIPSG